MARSDGSVFPSDVSICCMTGPQRLCYRAPLHRLEPHRLAARRMPRSLVERAERFRDVVDGDGCLQPACTEKTLSELMP